jgi:hypothetical protein
LAFAAGAERVIKSDFSNGFRVLCCSIRATSPIASSTLCLGNTSSAQSRNFSLNSVQLMGFSG